jgi:rhodanese-related sulfurtransferase
MEDILAPSGNINQDILHFSAREAFDALQKGAVLIDIREEYHTQMKIFQVENYIILPLSLFDENIMNLPIDSLLIIADASGLYCKSAAEKLWQKGFIQVAILQEVLLIGNAMVFPSIRIPLSNSADNAPVCYDQALKARNSEGKPVT